MENKLKLFNTGTMRTGGSLLINLLSAHSKMIMIADRVHFFRFVYKRYDPLTPENIERMLHHQKIRLHYRFNTQLEIEPIFQAIMEKEPSYRVCYDEMMNHLSQKTGKNIWGESVPFNWRQIPVFLNLFPEGKVFHIYRDLRGVLASWKRLTFMPDNLYLNCIFNWIDSINYLQYFKETLPADRYMPVKFEDLATNPEERIGEICSFLGVPFEENLIHPERWEDLFDKQLVSLNISSYNNQKVNGFDPARSERWRETIEDWELDLVEFLAKDQLEAMGYECVRKQYSAYGLRQGMELLRNQPLMLKNLNIFLATGNGSDQWPNDPTDPRNWSAPEDGFKRFSESKIYGDYIKELEYAESILKEKYS